MKNIVFLALCIVPFFYHYTQANSPENNPARNFLETEWRNYQARAKKETSRETQQNVQINFLAHIRQLVATAQLRAEFNTYTEDDMKSFLIAAMALKHGPPYALQEEDEQAAALFQIVVKTSDSESLRGIAQKSLQNQHV